jgi:hypothetical protein
MDPLAGPDHPAIFLPGPFLKALAPPLILWGGWVIILVLSRQPGVICVTPMAWLLALWSGGQYVHMCGKRVSLLGPALLGAMLGLLMGLLFIAVTSLAMPVSAPGELQKALILDAVITIAGVVFCAAFSMLTAALTRRRYR